MRSTLLLIFLLGMLLTPRVGESQAPPAPVVLANGLRVVMRERSTSSLVAIDLWVRAGAREEALNERGCAHLLEHTLFKGTTTRGPGETDIAIENLGATLNAATGPDFAHFYTTVARVHLTEALQTLADVVRNATLPDAEVEKERGVILDELAQHEATPQNRLIDLLFFHAFDVHPYRYSPGGTPGGIKLRGRETLAAFYRRCYVPERCTLALVGEITPEQAQKEAQIAFGDWKAKPSASSLPPANTLEPDVTVPRLQEEKGETPHPLTGIAFRMPAARETTMAAACQVLVAMLGQSEGGGWLATRALRGNEVSARYTPRQDSSLLLLTAQLSAPKEIRPTSPNTPTRLNNLETLLLNTLQSLQTSPPSLAEINAAKRRVLGQMQFETETNAGLARAIGYADLVSGDTPEQFRAHVLQLTQLDLQKLGERYLAGKPYLRVRLLSADERTP